MNTEFKLLVKQSRESLKPWNDTNFYLSFENLGYAIGLSKQHLQNLESLKQKVRVYSISLKKLKDLILFLSLKELNQNHINFIEKIKKQKFVSKRQGMSGGSSRNSEGANGYFSEFGYPKPDELNLNRLQKMLFYATELNDYDPSFIPTRKVLTDDIYINRFVNKLSLDDRPLNEIEHDYEIWTLSEVLGENVSLNSAELTANNILKYKIVYRNFVPLHDDLLWKIAHKNISKAIESCLNSNQSLENHWRDHDNWEKYWVVYGVSEIAFFTRFRIYNAMSPRSRGNYNIGSTSTSSIELVDMVSDDVYAVKNKLMRVVSFDKMGSLKSGDIAIEELSCFANKKAPLS